MRPRTSKARADKAMKPLKRGDIALLKGNSKRIRQIDEFTDKARPAMDAYYEITEQFQDQQISIAETKTALKHIIKTDKQFLDSYLFLAETEYEQEKYEEYSRLIWSAYIVAVNLVANADGDYPKSLPWGWLENRHIIRALCNFALLQWEQGHIRLALEIYRKLLASNLSDHIGARYSILAIRLGYNPDYEALFLPEMGPIYGLDGQKMDDWFNASASQFAEEFADYLKSIEDYN